MLYLFYLPILSKVTYSWLGDNTPWSDVGLKILLKGPTSPCILSWPSPTVKNKGKSHGASGGKGKNNKNMKIIFWFTFSTKKMTTQQNPFSWEQNAKKKKQQQEVSTS